MRAALYARVSTVNSGQDPEMQLRELREYVVNRGWQVSGEYVDRISGSKDLRPALSRLMTDVHQRKCDVVLVWKLDRWGRSLKHLVNSMVELEARGVALISLRDNFDLTTPAGRLMFQVIGAMAEFERSLIQERVKAGLRNARARGKRLGRPKLIQPNSLDATRIASLRARHCSWRVVARTLGCSARTCRRAWQKSLSGVSVPSKADCDRILDRPTPQVADSAKPIAEVSE